MDKDLDRIVKKSNYVVFFGGAGVSTESGIPDFRSSDGLYNVLNEYKAPPEKIISHSFFVADTNTFFDYYKKHMVYRDAMPGAAHLKLAELEKDGKLKAVITQNIDGLHQLAGSKNVIELHGSILRNTCMKCGAKYSLAYIMDEQNCDEKVPKCSDDACRGIVKPDVVLYEESLNNHVIAEAISHLQKADMLIIAGTSLAVYPAAGLIDYFKGETIVIINLDPTPRDKIATLLIHDSISQALCD